MNLLKKLSAGVASLAIALTALAVPASAGEPQFTDLNGHWSAPFVTELARAGVISTHDSAGNPKRNYYPNNSLTRGELTKLAVEAFYGDTVDDLAGAFADAGNPTFTDVPPGDWEFKYVEIVKGLDIVGGFNDGTFKPKNPITRGEALKVILLTGEIEDELSPAAPFSDINGHWAKDLVTTAYNHCIVKGTSGSTFSPNGNVTRGEAAKIILNALKISEGETLDSCEIQKKLESDTDLESETNDDTRDDKNAGGQDGENKADGPVTNEPTEDDTPMEGEIQSGVLEVSLSADTPYAKTIPKNAFNVPMTAVDLTNTSDEDVNLQQIVVSHAGLGYESVWDEATVFVGFMQKGNGRGFSSEGEIAEISLRSDPVLIPAGDTVTIILAGSADLGVTESGYGGEHQFLVIHPDDIYAVGTSGRSIRVTGDFPVEGEVMSMNDVAVGKLDIELKTVADTTLEVGTDEAECATIEIENTSGGIGGGEDILVKNIMLEFDGPDDGSIQNIYAQILNERISEIDGNTQNSFGVIDFSESEDKGFYLEAGDSRTFDVICDINGGVGETLEVQIDEVQSDVVAVGMTFGFGVQVVDNTPTDASSVQGRTIDISGGDINFTLDSEVKDIARRADDVELLTLTINNAGEDMEITSGIYFNVTEIDSGFSYSDLSNFKLVDVETSTSVLGTADYDTSTGDIEFSDSLFLDSGETLALSLQADVSGNAAENAEFRVALDMSKIEVEGIDSGEETKCCSGGKHDIRPTSNQTSDLLTIVRPGFTLTANSLKAETYVQGSDDKVVWSGTFSANDTEDIYIDSIQFDNVAAAANRATRDDVEDFTLWIDAAGADPIAIEIDEPFASQDGLKVTFTSFNEIGGDFIVPKSEEIDVIVTADISTTATASREIQLELNPTNITARDEDSNDITPKGNVVTAPLYTLNTFGSVAVEFDIRSESSRMYQAGLESVPVAIYDIDPDKEDVRVKDLQVMINPENSVDGTNTSGVYKISEIEIATANISTAASITVADQVIVAGSYTVSGDTITLTGAAPSDYFTGVIVPGTTTVSYTSDDATPVTKTAVIEAINKVELFSDAAGANPVVVDNADDKDGDGDTCDIEEVCSYDDMFVAINNGTTHRQIVYLQHDAGNIFDVNDEEKASVSLEYAAGSTANTFFVAGDELKDLGWRAVSKLYLEYSDGTAVLTNSGKPAVASVDSESGLALFTGLNLVADSNSDEDTEIVIKADIKQMSDNTVATARSGVGFSIQPVLSQGSETRILGEDSGKEFYQPTTEPSRTMYVFNNAFVATESSSQTKVLNEGEPQAHVLSFNIDTGLADSENPYLKQINVNISGSGAAGEEILDQTGNVYLLNGDNKVIATKPLSGGSPYSLIAGKQGATDCTAAPLLEVECDNISTVNGTFYYEVESGEKFTIAVDIAAPATDDNSISATIKVDRGNNKDDIIWRDGGTDGTDGIEVQWIDLGDSTASSTISNTISE